MSVITNSSEKNVLDVFKECWYDLLNEFQYNRLLNLYGSEGDVRFHLAHKLLCKIQFPYSVHCEFPIPVETEDFGHDVYLYGRPKRKMKQKGECIVADIVVRNLDDTNPLIIAEIKYNPHEWNIQPIIEAIERGTKEDRDFMKDALMDVILYLEARERNGPTKRELAYFLKNVDGMLKVVQNFKEREKTVYAYLCVIDELYPNLERILKEKCTVFPEFELLVKCFPRKDWLREQLAKLTSFQT